MTTESEATWDGFLKILYQPGNMTESLRDNFMFYSWLLGLSQVVPYGGDHIQFSVKSKRQAGVGFIKTGSSNLPEATASAAFKPQFGVSWTYGVGELDDMVMKISRSQNMAYQNAKDQVVDDLLVSMKMILNAAWYGNGTCSLGDMPGADNQTTITLLQPIHLMPGFNVDLVDATDNLTKLLSSVGISDVDHAGVSTNLLHGTVTHDGSAPAGTAEGDYFTPAGAIDASGNQVGPHGIYSGCTDADPPLESYGGIAVSAQTAWKGNRIHNSGTNQTWSLRKANALLQLILRRSTTSMSLSDIRIVNNRNVAQEIFEQAAPDRQIVTKGREALQLVPGFEGGSDSGFEPYAHLNGVNPMYQDEMAPANKQFFLTPRTWHITQTNPPELDQDDGNVLHRFEGRAAKQFRWRFPHNVYTHARTANGVYEDIAETNPLA